MTTLLNYVTLSTESEDNTMIIGDKYLKIECFTIPEHDIATIKILEQKYRRDKFSYGDGQFTKFVATNDVRLMSLAFPFIIIHDEKISLCVRGDVESEDNKVAVIINKQYKKILNKICDAVNEYNEYMVNNEIPDYYIQLHKETWNAIADNDIKITEKDDFVEKLCKEKDISIPSNHCFLCEETTFTTIDSEVNCNKCKGKWSNKKMENVCYYGYYSMWLKETDPDLRKALARRIANICD